MLTVTEDKEIVDLEKNFLIDKLNQLFTEKVFTADVQSEDNSEILSNEVAKSNELESLILSLKRQEWGNINEVQKSVIDRMRMEDGLEDITLWVKKMIHGIVLCNVAERKEECLNRSSLVRMGPSLLENAFGEGTFKRRMKPINCKRQAHT